MFASCSHGCVTLCLSLGTVLSTTYFFFHPPAFPSSLIHHVTPHAQVDSVVRTCWDPYKAPGYLYVNQSDYRRTTWIPYTKEFFDTPPLDLAAHPVPADFQLDFDARYVEEEFLKSSTTPRSWMNEVAVESERRIQTVPPRVTERNNASLFLQEKDKSHLGWLWGRRFLAMGDSVDRVMMHAFCDEVHGEWHEKWHDSSLCEVATFNLTLVHFHIISMLNYKPSWFEPRNMPSSFEERWDKLWAGWRRDHVRGLNGRGPDLIFWQTGLWDQFKLFFDLASHRHGAATDDKNVYQNASNPQAISRSNKRQAV